MRSRRALFALLTLIAGVVSAAPAVRAVSAAAAPKASTPPPAPLPGFTQTLLASGLHSPTSLAFAPNGDLWIGSQGGDIRVLHNGVLQPTPVITLKTDFTAELGLLGLAFDPNFSTNGYIYVSYVTTALFSELSRFTVVNGVAAASSEKVLVEGTQQQSQFGPGNDLHVGPDGELWWSVGGNPYPWGNAQALTNIYGKIIRVNLDGTPAADNPFLNVPGASPGVYAEGLRNPFRFTFLPDGRMMAADTGSSYWEELDTIQRGGNYGWDRVEGNCGSCGFINPVYAYGHVPADGAASALLAYTGSSFPSVYDHVVFFGDYNRQDIEAVSFDPTYHTATSDTVFDAHAGTVADIIEGPDGSLYYAGVFEGKVYRIAATGPFAPTAAAAATPNAGPAPLAVQFSSAGSAGAYGQPLTYSWSFGDGTPGDTTANPSHVYLLNGTYTATLTVSDGVSSAGATTTVVVGRSPATATIVSPAMNATYNAGDTITYSGTATDAVDGTLPAADYTWQVDFYSNGVAQPFYLREAPHPFAGPTSGVTSGSFTVPTDVSQLPGTFYRVTLTVVNSAGIPTVVTQDIHPNLTSWTATSNVSGAGFFVDGTWQTASDTVQDVVGVTHVLGGGPAQVIGGQRYRFSGWADGSALSDTFTSTASSPTYTADFEPVSSVLPAGGWQNVDVGSPLMAGATDYAAGSASFYLDGGGMDVGGSSEQFHYTYQALSGDGTIVARVRYQTESHPWAKAGVMIKQGTAAGSPYVAAIVTPDVSPNLPNINGINCTASNATNAGCDAPLPPVTPPVGHGLRMQASSGSGVSITSPATLAGFSAPNKWLKLQRTGNTFTTSFSTDGVTWKLIGSTSVTMSGPVTIGLFTASHLGHSLTTAAFDNVQVTASTGPPPPSCPTGWSCADIGAPSVAGSSSLSGGTWTINGAGSDIHGNVDQFQFASRPLAADGSISAHVTAQANTSSWAKAGVMLRAGTDPGAADYALLVTPGNGIEVQYRAGQGATTNRIAAVSGTAPAYLEVARAGTTFTAYTSADGSTWTLVPGSTVTIAMSGAVLQGLAVTSHNTSTLCTVTMDGVTPS